MQASAGKTVASLGKGGTAMTVWMPTARATSAILARFILDAPQVLSGTRTIPYGYVQHKNRKSNQNSQVRCYVDSSLMVTQDLVDPAHRHLMTDSAKGLLITFDRTTI